MGGASAIGEKHDAGHTASGKNKSDSGKPHFYENSGGAVALWFSGRTY